MSRPSPASYKHPQIEIARRDARYVADNYDRYAPAIYGSLIKMGVKAHDADDILCNTLLHFKNQLRKDADYSSITLLKLMLFAWSKAEHKVCNDGELNRIQSYRDVSQFLAAKGFSASQIAKLLAGSTVNQSIG